MGRWWPGSEAGGVSFRGKKGGRNEKGGKDPEAVLLVLPALSMGEA
jgi:hypothetical protein